MLADVVDMMAAGSEDCVADIGPGIGFGYTELDTYHCYCQNSHLPEQVRREKGSDDPASENLDNRYSAGPLGSGRLAGGRLKES